jgi:hypothetical protein
MVDEDAFKKWDNGGKNLIIPFAGNAFRLGVPPIFEFARSLSNMDLSSDVLFMKDRSQKWYLGGLRGIGNNIDHTVAFLRREIKNYDKVICLGTSAGGYASILFGSLLEVDAVIAFRPQTDLNYVRQLCKDGKSPPVCNPELDKLRTTTKLKTFEKYNNLNTVINSTTQYFVKTLKDNKDILHAFYHYENISEFPNVSRIDFGAKEMIENGELEKMLKTLLTENY